MYREGAMEWEKRGVGNISFRWWRKPECLERTTGHPQVTDNLLTYGYRPIHIGEKLIELRWPLIH